MITTFLLFILANIGSLAFAQDAQPSEMIKLKPQQPTKTPFEDFATDGSVNSIVISSNDNHVVAGTKSGDERGTIYYFDKNGNLLWSYTADRQILSVAVSSDGSYVAAGGGQFYHYGTYGPAGNDNGMIYFFDGKGNLLWKYDTNRPYVMSVAVSSDGSYIAVGTEKDILYFDKKGNLLWNHSVPRTNVHPVTISPDGLYVATKDEAVVELLDNNGNLLWNYTAGHGTQQDTSAGSLYLTMSPDGRYAITSDYADGILVFDHKGNLVLARSTETHLFFESVSSDGSFIAASAQQWGEGSPGDVYLYDIHGDLLWAYTGMAYTSISGDGSYVLAGTWDSVNPSLFFFDHDGNLLWNNVAGPVHAVAVSGNGSLAVAGVGPPEVGQGSVLFFDNNLHGIIPNKNSPVTITQVELGSPLAFFPDNQTCYDKPGFSNNYTCLTNLVPGHKVQCEYYIGSSYCEPIHQYTSGTNQSCFGDYHNSGGPQWIDVYNTSNKTVDLQNFTVEEKWNGKLYGRIGPFSSISELKPYAKCTFGFVPVDESLSLYLNNMSIGISYNYGGKDYNVTTPSLSDTSNDTRTWQFDGNTWTFHEKNTIPISEFPLVLAVFLASIASVIALYRLKSRIY